jgi:hypothetical protein
VAAVTSTGKSLPEIDRANRMFSVESAIQAGNLDLKEDILAFIEGGTPFEEPVEPPKRSISGFHTVPQPPR